MIMLGAKERGRESREQEERSCHSFRGRRTRTAITIRDKVATDDFDHPQKIHDLTEMPLRRGYGEANIHVPGGNSRRLPGTIWTEPKRPPSPTEKEEKKP
jgi:hypothetical protein